MAKGNDGLWASFLLGCLASRSTSEGSGKFWLPEKQSYYIVKIHTTTLVWKVKKFRTEQLDKLKSNYDWMIYLQKFLFS